MIPLRRLKKMLREEDESKGRTSIPPLADRLFVDPSSTRKLLDEDTRLEKAQHALLRSLDERQKTDAANFLGSYIDKLAPEVISKIAIHSDIQQIACGAIYCVMDRMDLLVQVMRNARVEAARKEAMDILGEKTEDPLWKKDDLIFLYDEGSETVKRRIAERFGREIDSVTDVAILKIIVYCAIDELTRERAIDKLAQNIDEVIDLKACKMIAVFSSNADARKKALWKVSEMPHIVADVAKLSSFEDTRTFAVRMLSGQKDLLMDVAKNACSKDSVELAVEQLKGDVEALKEIFKSNGKFARDASVQRLAEQIDSLNDVKALKYVVTYSLGSRDYDTLISATDRLASMYDSLLDDKSILYVALWATDRNTRLKAVRFFGSDAEKLDIIIRTSSYDDSKALAFALKGNDGVNAH